MRPAYILEPKTLCNIDKFIRELWIKMMYFIQHMRLFLLMSLGYVFALEYPVHNIHVLQHLLCKHTAVYTF